jgi:hypothetical protein
MYKMKSLFHSFLLCTTLLVGAISLPSCSWNVMNNTVRPSKNIITKEVALKGITAIHNEGSMFVVYRQSPETKMVIKGADNLVPLVDYSLEGGKLTVKLRKHIAIIYPTSIQNNARREVLTVYVYAPSVNELTLTGSGDLVVDKQLSVDNLNLTLEGSGDIKTGRVVCKNDMNATLNGSGDIRLGRVECGSAFNCSLQGSGDIDVLNEAVANTANYQLNGSGDLDINASTSIQMKANLQGSGDLKIKNITAKNLTGSLVGSGDLELKGKAINAVYSTISSGSIDAGELICAHAVCSTTGSGELTCAPVESLESTITGSGDIYYRGNPTVVNHSKRAPERQ